METIILNRFRQNSNEKTTQPQILGCRFLNVLFLIRGFLLYPIPKIKMLCNLPCVKARLRLLCNKLSVDSSLCHVSGQLKLCNIFILGMAYLTPKYLDDVICVLDA